MIYVLISVALILLIIGLTVANYAGSQFEDTFHKINQVPAYARLTGGQYSMHLVNTYYNGRGLQLVRTKGELTDAYSVKSKAVILSDSTCDVASVAALAVVAHEFGHAEQDYDRSGNFVRNRKLHKFTRIFGFTMLPLLVLGILLCALLPVEQIYIGFSCIGVSLLLFVLGLALKISTVGIEKDASKRAIRILQETNALDEEELEQARKVLKAALLTYIADFLRVVLAWTLLTKKTKMFY